MAEEEEKHKHCCFFFGRQKIYSININKSVPEVLMKDEQLQDTYGATLQKQKKPNQDPTTKDKGNPTQLNQKTPKDW